MMTSCRRGVIRFEEPDVRRRFPVPGEGTLPAAELGEAVVAEVEGGQLGVDLHAAREVHRRRCVQLVVRQRHPRHVGPPGPGPVGHCWLAGGPTALPPPRSQSLGGGALARGKALVDAHVQEVRDAHHT